MELIGEYRFPDQPPPEKLTIVTLAPSVCFPRPGVVWVERLNGDYEDATPDELILIQHGYPLIWRDPQNPAHVGKTEEPACHQRTTPPTNSGPGGARRATDRE